MEISSQEILKEIFTKSQKLLEANNYVVTGFKEISYGIQFQVKDGDWKGLVRIFRNNKGVIKYDYSPIKENYKKAKISAIIEGSTNDSLIPNESSGVIDIVKNYQSNIGTDESGKGDYFGPLVVAGVYVDARTKVILDKNGVRDSKKISDKKILELAEMIKRVCINQFVIIEIAPSTYNNLYETFQKEGKNLTILLAWGHAKAIEEVLTKVQCDLAISDKFADERFIIGKLQEKGKKITLIQEHKAEKHTSVAAASILARARFLEKIKKLSEEYGFDFLKGASGQVVEQAKSLVEKYDHDVLKNVAKLHFKTTEKVAN